MTTILAFLAGATLLSLGFSWADHPRPGPQLTASLTTAVGAALSLPDVGLWFVALLTLRLS